MKYNVGDIMYTKKPIQGIPGNTQVVITHLKKKGRKTHIKIQDDAGTTTSWIRVIKVRTKRR